MASSINQRLNMSNLDERTKAALRAVLEDMRLDVAAMATKLNADATVTDTNYNATPNVTA